MPIQKDESVKVRNINPFGLRMRPNVRSLLEEAAKQNGRSLNSEIVYRLEKSFVPLIMQTTYNAGQAESSVLSLQNKYQAANFSEIPLEELQSDLEMLTASIKQLGSEASGAMKLLSECPNLQVDLHSAILIRVAEISKEPNE